MTRRLPLLAAALAAGCTTFDQQSSLHPAGAQADRIHGVWDLYLWVCVVVYVLVVAVLFVGVVRRARVGSDQPITAPPVNLEVRKGVIVTGLVALTTLILFGFLIADFLAGRAIDSEAGQEVATVLVTGHQWWWEVRYDDPAPSKVFTTANELHVPVGKTVRVELAATDVIHSFWVPNLHGKTDAIPGHTTRTYLRADQPGVYWGQCAEFCGQQHANMRFLVVAEPEEDFRKWQERMRQDAPQPVTPEQKRGQQVFLTKQCVLCHTVNGTTAQARVGPDLTHVAGRPWIAAGTLPLTRGHLAGWVADAQSTKPGVRMPPNQLAPDELRCLLDYLETLK
jgi:cytochrome c oxidase subunit 2